MIRNYFIFNFTNFCIIVSFLTKLLILAILYSIAVRAVVVAKLVILSILLSNSFILALRAVVVAKLLMPGISFLTSLILALRVVLVPKIVISGILYLIFFILALYRSSLTTSFFITSLSLLKSTGTGTNLSTSN